MSVDSDCRLARLFGDGLDHRPMSSLSAVAVGWIQLYQADCSSCSCSEICMQFGSCWTVRGDECQTMSSVGLASLELGGKERVCVGYGTVFGAAQHRIPSARIVSLLGSNMGGLDTPFPS